MTNYSSRPGRENNRPNKTSVLDGMRPHGHASKQATPVFASRTVLAADSKTLDESPVALWIAIFQIFQQLATPRDHRQQTTPGVMIFLVRLEMLSQLQNTLAQKGNLYL